MDPAILEPLNPETMIQHSLPAVELRTRGSFPKVGFQHFGGGSNEMKNSMLFCVGMAWQAIGGPKLAAKSWPMRFVSLLCDAVRISKSGQ